MSISKHPLPPKLLAKVGLVVFATIKFFRPEKNILQANDRVTDLFDVHPAPPNVKMKVQAACYDCHSNGTAYPWYSYIQPVGWWLEGHIRDGKQELNLSEFGSLSRHRQQSKLEDMIDAITDRSMPLPSYTWVHHDA